MTYIPTVLSALAVHALIDSLNRSSAVPVAPLVLILAFV